MKKTTIWLTESQTKGLEALSRETGERQSVIIRRALDEYFGQQSHRVEWRIRSDDNEQHE